MVEKIIFDVSGTVWNDMPQVAHANLQVLQDQGIKNHPETGELICERWWYHNAKGSAVEMFRWCGIEGDDDYLNGLYIDALERAVSELPCELYSGMEDLLARLGNKGIPLSVISSHPEHRLLHDFERLNILGYFERGVIIGNCHNKANDIRKVAQSYNPPGAYIGDTTNDMSAASEAGVLPIAVSYGYHKEEMLRNTNPAFIARSVAELERYLLERIS